MRGKGNFHLEFRYKQTDKEEYSDWMQYKRYGNYKEMMKALEENLKYFKQEKYQFRLPKEFRRKSR